MRRTQDQWRFERGRRAHALISGRGWQGFHRALLIMFGCALLLAACGPFGAAPARETPTASPVTAASPTAGSLPALPYLHAPPGFRATEYAAGLNGPRFITFGPTGALFVAERNTGRILALTDPGRQG